MMVLVYKEQKKKFKGNLYNKIYRVIDNKRR